MTALADDATGLANEQARPEGRPWQEPDETPGGRVDLHRAVDTTGRTADRRSDFDSVYGDWSSVASHVTAAPEHLESHVLTGLKLAGSDPASLLLPANEAAALALLGCDGTALDEVTFPTPPAPA